MNVKRIVKLSVGSPLYLKIGDTQLTSVRINLDRVVGISDVMLRSDGVHMPGGHLAIFYLFMSDMPTITISIPYNHNFKESAEFDRRQDTIQKMKELAQTLVDQWTNGELIGRETYSANWE